ncbi:FAD-dependent monooxygenase [Nonomuraea sp. NPDC050556]|uniref:oxidoreductase n=1 Tax=Nonomuraea sp. NPDC050556 TaxID=3364369 RepID=UPI0037AE768C
MRLAVIGGGPGGLYFAALAKQLSPHWEITVWERNAADETFGFGVVFSDETLGSIADADPQVFAAMSAEFARWSDIDVRYRGRTLTSGGHGFAALERRRLLAILQERCAALGVTILYGTPAPPGLESTHDLVIAADGVRSGLRDAHDFGTTVDTRHCRYMWLATDKVFKAFTFIVEDGFQVHAYPYCDDRSTVIVETTASAWRPDLDLPRLEQMLAPHLDGHRLIANNSRWLRFATVRNRTWSRGNLVLLGDAAHTAHFSIGSGTKLAMEDALSLAACLHEHAGTAEALVAYEAERRPVVESTQRAAQASLEWFENIERHLGRAPEQFAFDLLTRSRRVTYDNLRLRDPEFVASVDGGGPPPMFGPLTLGGLTLRNRVVVPPLATFTATDGVPSSFDAAHLSTLALGGAGLVIAGMTAVSAESRMTSRCTGLYTDEQEAAWRRIVADVRAQSGTPLGIQLTHAGRRAFGPSIAASGQPWDAGHPTPRVAGVDDLTAVVRDFAAAAARADRAGFDVLQLQFGHGHLVSGYLSPLTNPGDRLSFPLEVLGAVRAVWDKPLIVRISAADWAEGGLSEAEAVAMCLAFEGADAIEVSTGEVVAHEQPPYGRGYQVPYADLIRAATGLPTIAVGAISTYDDVNSVILAGRADLCSVGRAHLHDPLWTLHAAAEQGYRGPGAPWPEPWQAAAGAPASRPARSKSRLRSLRRVSA